MICHVTVCVARVDEMLHVYMLLVLLHTINYIHVNTVWEVKMQEVGKKCVWYVWE